MSNPVTVNVTKLKKDLSSKVIVVEFQKLDGSTRVMKCTTNPNCIKSFYEKNNIFYEETPKSNRKKPEFAIPVYDIEKEDWRSFRWDKVITYRELTSDEYAKVSSKLWKYLID